LIRSPSSATPQPDLRERKGQGGGLTAPPASSGPAIAPKTRGI